MKILQLIYESHGSPFGFGGAGVRAYEIYKRLRERHEIDLVCMKYPGARDGEREGLQHIFLGTESRSLARSVLAYTVGASRYVRRFGNEYEVIVENFLPTTPFFAKFRTKTPVVLQVQGVMKGHYFWKFPWYYSSPMYLCEWLYPKLYERLLFASDGTRERLLAQHHGRLKLSEVIPNGVDKELFGEGNEEEDYILFFSRIDIYTKGLDVLVKAFGALSGRFPHMLLKLAGFPTDDVTGLIGTLPSDVQRKVEYAGFVEGRAKTALLSKAKVVVLPSRHESAPISILEAAACGKPLVVSDILEMEVVEKEGFGLSFPAGSVEGLKEKMEILLTDEALRKRMGEVGREWAAGFSWDVSARAFEDVLKKVVSAV